MTEVESSAAQRRPGGRAARVREAVHRAVLDVVIEDGVDKIGIPEISRRAGVRDSSIYRRWGTRENLILDTLLAASERLLAVPDTGTLHGDLTNFACELISYLDAPLGHALARTLASVTDSGDIADARKTFWETRYGAIKVMFDRAVDRGELPKGTDARVAVELLIAPIHFRNLLTREAPDDHFAEQLATYVVRAIRPDARQGPTGTDDPYPP